MGGDNFFSENFFRISWGGIPDGDILRMGGDNGGGLTHTWGGTTNIKHQTKLHAKPYCGYHIGTFAS